MVTKKDLSVVVGIGEHHTPLQRPSATGNFFYMTYPDKLKLPQWQKKRLEILNRDQFTCQNCFDTKTTLHVHHIAPDYGRDPWDCEDNHLITLCQDCHKHEEEQLKEACKTLLFDLKQNRLGSVGLSSVAKIFETDRGWYTYEPAYDVLKMVVDDDELW